MCERQNFEDLKVRQRTQRRAREGETAESQAVDESQVPRERGLGPALRED